MTREERRAVERADKANEKRERREEKRKNLITENKLKHGEIQSFFEAEAATEKGLKEERSERTGLDLSTYTYCYESPS